METGKKNKKKNKSVVFVEDDERSKHSSNDQAIEQDKVLKTSRDIGVVANGINDNDDVNDDVNDGMETKENEEIGRKFMTRRSSERHARKGDDESERDHKSYRKRDEDDDDEEMEEFDANAIPKFPALSAQQMTGGTDQFRRIRVPPHRLNPLKNNWENIMKPLVEHMKLLVRYNPAKRCVELKTCPETIENGAIAKGADFVAAFCLGFDVKDAIALLRLDDLFVESFEIRDVKPLHGDHLSRAIGRIAGQNGKTKNVIENATRTRIVLADHRIHMLGSYNNIKLARDAICRLIMGAPPGKVYNRMRNVAARMNERF